ncbi:hypothetical protein [Leptospira ilyithenensis]|uniref:Rhodanese domain-containing protein n=1 Tax=Leptospira ilyithenensis TaxID=2484901 RepID=A0A4R9LJY3_9LEPT|nr:hypothetical protein [Leptospira ilyithenensis]TGN07153.1 hypothetical protein EHS11_18785 [Leptospira ilyithenensis]
MQLNSNPVRSSLAYLPLGTETLTGGNLHLEENTMKKIIGKLAVGLVLFGFLGACKKDKDDNTGLIALAVILGNGVRVNSAADLASESADNYDNNNYGLVTATTVKKWIANWAGTKPDGISGNLIILQSNTAGTGQEYIKPATGVYVYDWNAGGGTDVNFRQERNSGVTYVPTGLPDGARTDAFLKLYNIDLTKDLVVFAAGTDSATGVNVGSLANGFSADLPSTPKGSIYQTTGRGLFWLRYWGADKKNIAILDGDIKSQFAVSELVTTGGQSSPPNTGTFSVKSLKSVDNSVLAQPVENIIAFVKAGGTSSATGFSGSVFIADARFNTTAASNEYAGVASATGVTEYNTGGVTAQNKSAIEGHIKGAVFAPWPKFINQSTGRFKTKSEIAALWKDVTWQSDNTGKSGYQDGQVILQYCRTNARSMITGMSTFIILGKPTAFYDNSWIEWSSLTATTGGKQNLPSGSKFATDSADVTEGLRFNATGVVANYSNLKVNANATTSRQIQIDDLIYKNQ